MKKKIIPSILLSSSTKLNIWITDNVLQSGDIFLKLFVDLFLIVYERIKHSYTAFLYFF